VVANKTLVFLHNTQHKHNKEQIRTTHNTQEKRAQTLIHFATPIASSGGSDGSLSRSISRTNFVKSLPAIGMCLIADVITDPSDCSYGCSITENTRMQRRKRRKGKEIKKKEEV
jgi:hypothetical protein